MMRYRLSYDHARDQTELSFGGERWWRKGGLSIAEFDRLRRAIVESQGSHDVLKRWGFRRYRPPRSRAA